MHNLLDNSSERVYFKDLDSRFLLLSHGYMLDDAPGLSESDLLGKTDFDIFSEPHAIAAFEDEQRIIRTGEPILGKIERETFPTVRTPGCSPASLPFETTTAPSSAPLACRGT